MKLVVTGHDSAGKSVFSYTGDPPRSPSPGSYALWSTSGQVTVPDPTDADSPAQVNYFPIDGETAFTISTVPGKSAGFGIGDFFEQMPEGLAKYFDPDDPEMHTTDTIDYVVVLSGTAELELDDGQKEALTAGDCIVQRGTRHAWRVTSDEPLVLAAVLIGAKRL